MFMCVLVIEGERGGGAVGARCELGRFSAARRGGKGGFSAARCRGREVVSAVRRGGKGGFPRRAAGVGSFPRCAAEGREVFRGTPRRYRGLPAAQR